MLGRYTTVKTALMRNTPSVSVGELIAAVAIAVLVAVWSARIQQPVSTGYMSLEEYWRLADQFSTGESPHAEVPFAYRIGVPWIVSQLSPHSLPEGFLAVNVTAGIVTAPVLLVWLGTFVRKPVVRLAMVLVYAATWLSAVRYPFSNPVYVDPLFVLLLLIGLRTIQSLKERLDVGALSALCVTCVAGTFVRETMLLVPIAWLFADNPLGLSRMRAGEPPLGRFPAWARWSPLVASLATMRLIHGMVRAEGERSLVGAALQWVHKPVSSFVLSWLTVFGPLLAVALYDWRWNYRFLNEHEDLLVFTATGTALVFIGGADTERFLLWLMPVVYLVIAVSLERQWPAIVYPPIAVSLVACQAVAARVCWSIPDVDGGTPLALGATSGPWTRIYGVFNRLFVMDDFYWNLWSSFGSSAFRLARLVVYSGVVSTFMLAIHFRLRASAHSRP